MKYLPVRVTGRGDPLRDECNQVTVYVTPEAELAIRNVKYLLIYVPHHDTIRHAPFGGRGGSWCRHVNSLIN